MRLQRWRRWALCDYMELCYDVMDIVMDMMRLILKAHWQGQAQGKAQTSRKSDENFDI